VCPWQKLDSSSSNKEVPTTTAAGASGHGPNHMDPTTEAAEKARACSSSSFSQQQTNTPFPKTNKLLFETHAAA
jgi:hypothetical protein